MPRQAPSHDPSERTGGRGAWWVFAAWLAFLGGGFALLASYSTTAGARGTTPTEWPQESALPHDPGAPAIVLFLHPRCPCSRATLTELEEILAKTQERRPEVVVVFAAPREVGPAFVEGELWSRVRAMPGVRPWVDVGEVEAHRFGAETSGHLVVYGPDLALRFSGGITPTRGHVGPNPGERAVVAALDASDGGAVAASVFGCPLDGPPREVP
ncbi:MAG: RedB protein [Deltaproteobacteria bacterium]|nr:RedB protein [Deltaproteobacteria bacterium]